MTKKNGKTGNGVELPFPLLVCGGILGIFLGALLIWGGIALLLHTEEEFAQSMAALERSGGNVVSISPDVVAPENQGKLVHLTGNVHPENTLRDEEFGVVAPALKLRRNVEMFQRYLDERPESHEEEEAREKREEQTRVVEGKPIMGYRVREFRNRWARELISPDDEKNPHSKPFIDREFVAEITVGSFSLSGELIKTIKFFEPFSPRLGELPEAPGRTVPEPFQDGYFFIGSGNLAHPVVGDIRVSFETVNPFRASILAAQIGRTLSPYTTSAKPIFMLVRGDVPADQMVQKAKDEGSLGNWVLRVFILFLLTFGFFLVLLPVAGDRALWLSMVVSPIAVMLIIAEEAYPADPWTTGTSGFLALAYLIFMCKPTLGKSPQD